MLNYTVGMVLRLPTPLRRLKTLKSVSEDFPEALSFFVRNRISADAEKHENPANTCAMCWENIRFRARYCDWLAVIQVMEFDEYKFLTSIFDAGARPIVADLGANIGLFSVRIFSAWPGAVIHAVEPGGKTFEVLRQNKNMSSELQWHVYHAAIWDKDGELQFENHPVSTNSRVAFSGQGNECVAAITVRSFIEQHIKSDVDFMKMDIEGSELAAIESDPGIFDRVAVLFVEIHPRLCDVDRVVRIIKNIYPFVYVVGSPETKPYMIGARRPLPFAPYGTA